MRAAHRALGFAAEQHILPYFEDFLLLFPDEA